MCQLLYVTVKRLLNFNAALYVDFYAYFFLLFICIHFVCSDLWYFHGQILCNYARLVSFTYMFI